MLVVFFLSTLAQINIVRSCTEFIVECKDEQKSVIVGRTQEFSACVPCDIVSTPKQTELVGDVAPSCTTPLKWNSKHKTLYIAPNTERFEDNDIWSDGQNDAGLSVGSQYLPGYGSYPVDVPEVNCSNSMSHLQVVKFILTHYSTVQEVRSAIEGNSFPFVWKKTIKVDVEGDGNFVDTFFPMHWSIVDKTGDGIVLEYTEREGRRVFDNQVGVFTNSPTYDWHTVNLNNFINLQGPDFQPKTYTRNDKTYTLTPPGQGSGLLGVPGDFTPPSRFIRTAAMLRFSGDASNALEGALKAWHIINSVDITKGINDDKTCWSVVKDLTNNIMYYRDIDYISIRKVELDKTSDIMSHSYTVSGRFEDAVEDMTDKFQDYSKSEL